LGIFPVSMSLFGTWFGAETILGSSAAIAQEGLQGARAEPFGYAICLILTGIFVAFALRARGYLTLADLFRERFDRRCEFLVAISMIVVSTIWAAAQLLALSALLETAIGTPRTPTLIAATIVVLVYTSFGGIRSDVATDVVQGAVLLVLLIVLFFSLLNVVGGLTQTLELIRPGQLTLVAPGEPWLTRIDAWAIPILGSLVTQEAVSRFLAARSPEVAQRSCFIAATLYLAIGLVPVLIGLVGANLNLPDADGDNFLPVFARTYLPIFGYIVLSGALLSAILSTVDSNFLSVSSFVTNNVLPQNFGFKESTRLLLARGATVAAGLAALLVAFAGSSIYDLIQLTSALGQAGILVAVLFGLYSRFGGGHAAFGAIIGCMVCNAYTMAFWPLTQPNGPDGEPPEFSGGFLLSTVFSLVVYVLIANWEKRRAAGQTPPNAL
jgi:Na+/proline symporter